MPEGAHRETGGVRYGRNYWAGWNYTWPFATLTVSREQILIRVSLGKIWRRDFLLARSQVIAIRKKGGLWSIGIEIEHSNAEIPPFLLFWTFGFETLKHQLEKYGYELDETRRGQRDFLRFRGSGGGELRLSFEV